MGQGAGRQLLCGGRPRLAVQPPVVALDQVQGRGTLPVSSRYTSGRALEQDFVQAETVLGTGRNGPVRLAVGLHDGKDYAVKSFKKSDLSAVRLAELKNEAQVYLALDHPHVARLEMVYETVDEVHFVMEHLAGGDLAARLLATGTTKNFAEDVAAGIAHQMLLAVSYLHAHRVAHRDIKLGNVVFANQASNHLKIIDFGFAQLTDGNTAMTRSCGSLHYVAPEVLAKSYTEKADLWSMGVVVYMILTGKPPFFGSDDSMLRKIRRGDVSWSPRFKRLSQLAQDFVKSLLVVDPLQRLSALEALKHPWIEGFVASTEAEVQVSTLQSLRRFSDAPKFRRSVLSMMAWASSDEDSPTAIREQFLSIDTDCSGTISLEELRAVLSQHFQLQDAEAEMIFRRLDTDGSKEIEYSEFLAAVLLGQKRIDEMDVDMMDKTFRRFDRNGDGTISHQELQCIFGDAFSDEDIKALLVAADTSGDGKLDYGEFMAHLESESSGSTREPSESCSTPCTSAGVAGGTAAPSEVFEEVGSDAVGGGGRQSRGVLTLLGRQCLPGRCNRRGRAHSESAIEICSTHRRRNCR